MQRQASHQARLQAVDPTAPLGEAVRRLVDPLGRALTVHVAVAMMKLGRNVRQILATASPIALKDAQLFPQRDAPPVAQRLVAQPVGEAVRRLVDPLGRAPTVHVAVAMMKLGRNVRQILATANPIALKDAQLFPQRDAPPVAQRLVAQPVVPLALMEQRQQNLH